MALLPLKVTSPSKNPLNVTSWPQWSVGLRFGGILMMDLIPSLRRSGVLRYERDDPVLNLQYGNWAIIFPTLIWIDSMGHPLFSLHKHGTTGFAAKWYFLRKYDVFLYASSIKKSKYQPKHCTGLAVLTRARRSWQSSRASWFWFEKRPNLSNKLCWE